MPRSDVKHLRREPAPLCGTSHFRRAFVPDLCVRRVSDSRQTKGVHAPGRSDFSYSSSILFAGSDDRRSIVGPGRADGHTRHVLAAILTIGNELVSGDTENTNASWLARRLESLGVKVAVSAAVPDEAEGIVDFIRREGARVDHLIVTGGLGAPPTTSPASPSPSPTALRRRSCRGSPTTSGRGSMAIRTTPPVGPRFRAAHGRSTIRSAARQDSGSGTRGCCPASRVRWRRCSTSMPASSPPTARSGRGAAATRRASR